MPIKSSLLFRLFFLVSSLAWLGCSSEPTPPAEKKASNATTAEPSKPTESKPAKPFVLGDMIEPFDPPTLEKLLAAHEWEDRPVVDSMQRMRAHQAKLPSPQLTAKEALELRNDSSENNEKILDALGRLAPEDGEGVDYDAEITLMAQGDLKTTNPLLMSSTIDFDCNSFTGFGLFGFDRNFDKFASKDAVVSWQTSEDRMIDKVVLRDDLTWSDGKPITAHDLEFTFQVILTDSVIIPAVRQGTDQLRYVKAYGDHTVVFFHKEALATNDTNLGFPVLPKHIYEKTIPEDPTMTRSEAHSRLEDHPVVGGGYTLTKRVRGQEFVLTRRESS
ncbi:MAG: peptide ABC transporter substrate-binding protein, partial [Planctomycetes bacterium]|nr:peptide ABC transporter substrate-binding protein [Planctomycetota bacterium]